MSLRRINLWVTPVSQRKKRFFQFWILVRIGKSRMAYELKMRRLTAIIDFKNNLLALRRMNERFWIIIKRSDYNQVDNDNCKNPTNRKIP